MIGDNVDILLKKLVPPLIAKIGSKIFYGYFTFKIPGKTSKRFQVEMQNDKRIFFSLDNIYEYTYMLYTYISEYLPILTYVKCFKALKKICIYKFVIFVRYFSFGNLAIFIYVMAKTTGQTVKCP